MSLMTASNERFSWHSTDVEKTLNLLQASPEGLTSEEAKARLVEFGPNLLHRSEKEGCLLLIWRQLNSPLIYVLLASAALALATGKFLDALVVMGVVVLNALVGFIQEYKAEKAIDALNTLVADNSSVLRDGLRVTIPAVELVPGDIVCLTSGDKVPADLRIISSRSLSIDESMLTGESHPVAKQTNTVLPEATLGDRLCLAYSGTLVTYGTAEGVVVTTGMNTEIGYISAMLKETTRLQTPLTVALDKVSKIISLAIVVVSLLILAFGLYRGYSFIDSVLAAIALAVAAIPEGLPSITTIILAIGVKRMARRNAIIRHLPAVETLGSTTVICTDKTGTLTKNEMTVTHLWTDGELFTVSGVGYTPTGSIEKNGVVLDVIPENLRELLLAGTLCNDAALCQKEASWEVSGDPTEGALVVSAEKAGLKSQDVRAQWPRIDSVPFESERKYMATLHRNPEGKLLLYLKGAPEFVIQQCAFDPSNGSDSESSLAKVERLASQGMRVLAFAVTEAASAYAEPAIAAATGKMRFLGLQGLIDPPRPEVKAAVSACHNAGITVKMITGDHKETARAIGRELGLETKAGVVTGLALEGMNEEEFSETARQTNIFARVAPEHKLRLVRSLQSQGQIVAMTGDGVNDAPALKQSNIGVAMGITGTAVSREAADIILTDDNFSSIAAAVEEGRRVYDNLTKSLAFILPTNLGEAMIILVAVLFFPMANGQILMPIMPVQILWINLVATVTLALPLGFEAMEPKIMCRRPRDPQAPILSSFVVWRTLLVSILITIGGVGLFLFEYFSELSKNTPVDLALQEAQTMAVTTVILMQVFYLFNCRSLRNSVLTIGLFTNNTIYLGIGALLALQLAYIYLPEMNVLFGSAPLNADAWIKTVLCASVVLPIISFEKWMRSSAA